MIPAQSIRHLVICTAGVIGFIALAIYPAHTSLSRLDKEIKKAREDVREQQALYPIARDMLKEVMKKEESVLPWPRHRKLQREATPEISHTLAALAEDSGLEPMSILPDVASLGEKPGYLSIFARLRGEFKDFRNYLVKMGSLGYLAHVEEIKIHSTVSGKKELCLKIWLSVEK